MIVQFSTGGRGRALEQRGSMLHLRPDMASLATGSVNFPTIVYENPPVFVRDLATRMRDLGIMPEIEVFDLAMLYNTADLVTEGLIMPPPHVQFVFGVKHALPAHRDISNSRWPNSTSFCRTLPGLPRELGATNLRWLGGRWSLADTAEPGWRTISAWIAIPCTLECGVGGAGRRNGGSGQSLRGERARGSLHSRPASGYFEPAAVAARSE